MAKPDATEEELTAACKKASIHDFIMSLPKGYDTEVGELGDTLSGGERQRIGLARVFLHDAPFIPLDEPTSNLDSLNEAVILQSLAKDARQKDGGTGVAPAVHHADRRPGLFGRKREDELMRDQESKREREKKMVSEMIALYCKKKHHTKITRKKDGSRTKRSSARNAWHCQSMRARADDKCPFMETKTFCSNCRVHCYKPEMREKIREVMRFSGPRMLFYHPIMALRHVIESRKDDKK